MSELWVDVSGWEAFRSRHGLAVTFGDLGSLCIFVLKRGAKTLVTALSAVALCATCEVEPTADLIVVYLVSAKSQRLRSYTDLVVSRQGIGHDP